jgi:pimeloyl-ACP methyl ester carboxylesterase
MKEALWKHEYIDVDNLRMHYVTQGKGPLMLMIHGFPEFWYSWRHQIPVMAERFKVVAPDMRGYNQTEKPVGVGQYRLDVLTADVAGLIKALGYEKAVVVAHDWGGVVAWAFAMQYPKMVDRLIILNCPPSQVLIEHLMKNPKQLRRSYYMFLFQIPLLPEAVFRFNDYMMIEKAFRGWAIDKSAFSDHDIKMLKEAAAKPGALTASVNYYRAALRNLAMGFAAMKAVRTGVVQHKVKSPTLVIWAEGDAALGTEMTYDIHKVMDAPLEIRYIPDCSHWVQQERPGEVNRFMQEWLADYPEKTA